MNISTLPSFPSIPIVMGQTSSSGSASFKTGCAYVGGVILMVAFMYAVIGIINGGRMISKGAHDEGKSAILGALVIAGAFAIVGAIFAAFGLSGAAITPSF